MTGFTRGLAGAVVREGVREGARRGEELAGRIEGRREDGVPAAEPMPAPPPAPAAAGESAPAPIRAVDYAILAVGALLAGLVVVVLLRTRRSGVTSITDVAPTARQRDRLRVLGWVGVLSLLAASGLAYLEAGLPALVNQWHQLADVTWAVALGTLLLFGLDLLVLRGVTLGGLVLGDHDPKGSQQTISPVKQVALIYGYYGLWIVCIYIAAFTVGIND